MPVIPRIPTLAINSTLFAIWGRRNLIFGRRILFGEMGMVNDFATLNLLSGSVALNQNTYHDKSGVFLFYQKNKLTSYIWVYILNILNYTNLFK